MNRRRSISFLIVLALVAAMLYPVPLHHCRAFAMPAVGDGAASGMARSCCGADLVNCHCLKHEEGKRSGSNPVRQHVPSAFDEAPGCACVTIPQIVVDAAVRVSAQILPAPFAALLPALPHSAAGLAVIEAPLNKVGSSPPHLASNDHYTYLRTSVLLI